MLNKTGDKKGKFARRKKVMCMRQVCKHDQTRVFILKRQSCLSEWNALFLHMYMRTCLLEYTEYHNVRVRYANLHDTVYMKNVRQV